MSLENRIESVTVTPSIPRQTPKTEFGAVLSSKLGDALELGGVIVSGLVGRGPVLSAAVSGVKSMASVISSANAVTSAVRPIGETLPQTTTGASAAVGGEVDKMMLAIDQQGEQSKQYLALQMAMQSESREYNAVSNILKVRHDSAKAAINNVR